MERFPITVDGFKRLEAELNELKKVKRPDIIERIAEAREHGDLKENAEYHAAREAQSFIEGRIMSLEDMKARAEIIDLSKISSNQVKFGATIKLVDVDDDKEYIYQITGEYEADLEKGLISIQAPIARAMIGKVKGDSFEVITPKGSKEYEILEIKYN